jgi:simple sugar transport system permease protein
MIKRAHEAQRPRRFFRGASLYLGLIAIFVAGCLLEPAFISLDNQRDVLQRVSINGVLAVGMTLVIITAGIDLSVGSMLSLCSVLCAMMVMGREWNRGNLLAVACTGCAAAYAGAFAVWRLLSRPGLNRTVRLCAAGAAGIALLALTVGWGTSQAHAGFGVLGLLVFVPIVGATLGSVSGFIIARGRLQAFIVTLAMMIALVGMAKYVAGKGGQIHAIYVLSAEEQSSEQGLDMLRKQLAAEGKGYASESFAALGRSVVHVRTWDERLQRRASAAVVPIPGLFFLGCVLVAAGVLSRLPFGRYVYAVGGNEETARFSGINVAAVKTGVYAISGLMAGLGAVLYCAMYGQGKPDAGQGGELDAIAAVVIGGASLTGGRGRIAGTLVGVLIFGYLSNILVLKGIPSEVQDILKGAIIIGAVVMQEGRLGQGLLDSWRRRKLRKETGP